MKITTIMRIVFSTIGLSVLATVFVVYQLNSLVTNMDNMSKIRYQSYQTADELRQSSDDLTRLGRTYVVTGDDKYEKMYMDILAIRNGDKPRPENYHSIYWDLVLNYGDKPKPDGEAIALKTTMEKLGFSAEEFELLAQAQANSDGLVNMEVKAMNAAKGIYPNSSGKYELKGEPDSNMAIALLHSNEYHREKAKIMKPIDEFFVKLENRTQNQLDKATEAVKNYVLLGSILMILVLLTAVAGYFIVARMVTAPILGISKVLSDIDHSHDLSIRLPSENKNEVGSISTAINNLLEQYRQTIQKILSVNTEIFEIAGNIKSVSSTSSQMSSQQNDELLMAATAMEEMTTALASVSESTCQAESHAGQSEHEANSGLEVFNKTKSEFEILDNEFHQTTSIIAELANESNNVSNVLEVIKAIAEQTNLLALNAAIEAARAGGQGRGFAVVADEVRSLAQRTQESTVEIESMISALQDKAHLSTRTIQSSTLKMKGTRQNIETAGDALRAIQLSVTDIHKLNTTVASATEEQLCVSNEISENISKIKLLSVNIEESVSDLTPLAEQMLSNTNDLKGSVEHFKT